ncbi:MAG: hypothetical protein HGA61_00750 [Candidatus Moranbacteria bacterium]|nr:hypothetical protein [Candidatus Moranbacteria bacterium]
MKKASTQIRKIVNYLEAFIESDHFQDEIKKLRIKYKIPVEGYEFSKEDQKQLDRIDYFYFPDSHKNKIENLIVPLGEDLNEIQKMTPLRFIGFKKTLYLYLFHNKLFEDVLLSYLKSVNLCKVADSVDEYADFYRGTEDPLVYLNYLKTENDYFPAHLRISPYASKRDIIKFIEENYSKLIKPIQEKYKNPDTNLGKVRNRRKKGRNNLILSLRSKGKSLTEIRKEIKEKTNENLGYEDVAKILSIERKRRKV